MTKNRKKDTITTLVGPDVSIEGVIEFQGTIRLDGTIKGKIHTDNGMVVIGERAVVNAEIHVDAAIVMGEVNGTINAREKIEVFPPARIFGDLQAPIVSIESGVVFNGTCRMNSTSLSTPKQGNLIESRAAAASKI
ncbi:polymer-forming cytoskeletal protein [Thermodesulfobacteriota bacterium]